jgi:hypothetical protein
MRIVSFTLFPSFLFLSIAVYSFLLALHPFVLHVPCQHKNVVFSVVVVCPSRFRVSPLFIVGLLLFTRTHTPLIPAVSPTTATLPDSLTGRSPFPGFSQAHLHPPLFCCHRKGFPPTAFRSSPVFRHPSQRAVPSRNALSQGPLRDPFRFSFPAQTLRFAPAVARARPPGFGSFRFAPSKKSLTRFANPGQPSETSHLLRLWKVKPPLVRLDSNSISKGPNQNAQPH